MVPDQVSPQLAVTAHLHVLVLAALVLIGFIVIALLPLLVVMALSITGRGVVNEWIVMSALRAMLFTVSSHKGIVMAIGIPIGLVFSAGGSGGDVDGLSATRSLSKQSSLRGMAHGFGGTLKTPSSIVHKVAIWRCIVGERGKCTTRRGTIGGTRQRIRRWRR